MQLLAQVVDPRTLGANLWLIIGALIALGLLAVIAVVAWTGFSVFFWRRQRAAADEQEERRQHRPDGVPYPPSGRGVCDGCQRGCEQVYYLPDGRRLCRTCYEQSEPRRSAE